MDGARDDGVRRSEVAGALITDLDLDAHEIAEAERVAGLFLTADLDFDGSETARPDDQSGNK